MLGMHLLMSSNRDVITAALRMLTVIDSTETPSAEDAQQGLAQLNDLFALLAADGADLGWPTQDDLSDDFPMDSVVEAQIKPILAMHLYSFYPSANVPDSVPVLAARATSQIKRASVLANMEESSLRHTPLGEVGGGLYNISTDSF